MILIIAKGSTEVRAYSTLTAAKRDYPQFSILYLQNIGLSMRPKFYKGNFIYRIKNEDIIRNQDGTTKHLFVRRHDKKNKADHEQK